MANSAFTVGGATISGGALVYLGTQTANSSGFLQFFNLFSNTYNQYVFMFNNILPATNNTQLYCQLGTGATPTYVTANYQWSCFIAGAGTSASTYNNSDAQAVLNNNGGLYGLSNTNANMSGYMQVTGTNGTSQIATASGEYTYNSANGPAIWATIPSWAQPAAVFTAIKFYMSSGNIASGSISMYGVASSGTSGGSGGYALLANQTAAASSSITFSGLSLSAYSAIDIVSNLTGGTSNNGANLILNGDSGSNYTYSQMYSFGGSSVGAAAVGPTTSFLLYAAAASTQPAVATVRLYNPSSSTNICYTLAAGIQPYTGSIQTYTGNGYWAGTGPVTSLTITCTNGTFSGPISVYGLLN